MKWTYPGREGDTYSAESTMSPACTLTCSRQTWAEQLCMERRRWAGKGKKIVKEEALEGKNYRCQ